MNDFETKYIANSSLQDKARAWLDLNFDKDPSFPAAVVSSIYFDTHNLHHLSEKVESDHIKSKFRLRWYEDIETGQKSYGCFLEFKHKVGERRFKKRIDKPNQYDSEDLDQLSYENVLDELRLNSGQVLPHVFPALLLSYTRHRYVVPDTQIRLCIDSDICIKSVNYRLMCRSFRPQTLSQCVFEMKGETTVLPKPLVTIEKFGFVKSSFSKYEQCINELVLKG